jgi:hypothetical protein
MQTAADGQMDWTPFWRLARDPNANSGGDSNANSGGESSAIDTQQFISEDPNAISGRDSNSSSGGESEGVETQQAISRDSNANSGGVSNANSGGQSATNASVPAALEERNPPARRTTRRVGVYDVDTSTTIHHFREQYKEATARVNVLEREVANNQQRVIYLQSLLDEDRGD